MTRFKNDIDGLTLIELLVTVMIVSICISIIAVGFSQFSGFYHRFNAKDDLAVESILLQLEIRQNLNQLAWFAFVNENDEIWEPLWVPSVSQLSEGQVALRLKFSGFFDASTDSYVGSNIEYKEIIYQCVGDELIQMINLGSVQNRQSLVTNLTECRIHLWLKNIGQNKSLYKAPIPFSVKGKADHSNEPQASIPFPIAIEIQLKNKLDFEELMVIEL